MAIKISGTTVIDDSRTLLNVIGLKTINGNSILGSGDILVGGNVAVRAYTTPATWTKPAGLKAIKVTVVGGGGASGPASPGAGGGGAGTAIGYLDASQIPGPVSVTIGNGGIFLPASGALYQGNTSSFGPFFSATGGGGTPGLGGTGSGGVVNISGGDAGIGGSSPFLSAPTTTRQFAITGKGGDSLLGFGGATQFGTVGSPPGSVNLNSVVGKGYGAGASGIGATGTGANGTSGIVIVEEYY